MKKLRITLGLMMLVALMASPALAHGPGWGMSGGGMMGNRGMGAGPGWRSAPEGEWAEQQAKLHELWQGHWNEMAGTRNEMWAKKSELRALLAGPEPDAEKAKALQKEILQL